MTVTKETTAPLEAGLEHKRRHKLERGQCAYCDREGGNTFHPSHDASDACESGRHSHCSCDTCF